MHTFRVRIEPLSERPILRPVMPELDSVRGIAIVAVLLYHGLYWHVNLAAFPRWQGILLSGFWLGRLGVNLFFVLSGFLITGLLIDSKSRLDYYRRFYVRRALRILPAYVALLGILAVTRHASWAFILLSLAYLANFTRLFGVAIAYPVLWSLAVEEHFYLLWPWVVRKLSMRSLAVCCLVIIALSPLLRLWSFHLAARPSYVINDYTWNSADGLACGALLAISIRLYSLSRVALLSICAYCATAAAGLIVIGWPFGILSRHNAFGMALQIIPWQVFFVALLALFLFVGSGSRAALVQSPFLRFFGEISYGLYLIHILVFDAFDHFSPLTFNLAHLLFRLLIAGCVSVLLAYISRKQFENRFLRLKDRITVRSSEARERRPLNSIGRRANVYE